MISRKEFYIIAQELATVAPPKTAGKERETYVTTVRAIAKGCKVCNPRFNETLFLAICGG